MSGLATIRAYASILAEPSSNNGTARPSPPFSQALRPAWEAGCSVASGRSMARQDFPPVADDRAGLPFLASIILGDQHRLL